MEEIVVIECLSSGQMYVEEIIDRGYKCLVLNPKVKDKHLKLQKKIIVEKFLNKYDSYQFEAKDVEYDLDSVLKILKGRQIVAVVAGSEYGVRLADLVTSAFGLAGNNPKTTDLRCTKSGMIKALKDAGIRAIKTAVVKTEEQVRDFWYDNNIDKAFLKFAESAAGHGTKRCDTCTQAVEHFKKMVNMPNYFGKESDDILIQEFISGPEYVVNTISCQGKHILGDMWKYAKVINDQGQILYQSSTLVHELDDTTTKLLDYAMKVLDAEHFEFGPCHGEFKIDHKGPVLIETNPRPMGDSMSRDYMLDICGQCIVDWSLDSILKQKEFLAKINSKPKYKTRLNSCKKYIILDDEMTGDMASAFCIAKNMKTFHNCNEYAPAGIQTYPKTKDLGDTPLIAKFASNNADDVFYDTETLNEIEHHYPQIICTSHPNLPEGKPVTKESICYDYEKIAKEHLSEAPGFTGGTHNSSKINKDKITNKVLVFHKDGNYELHRTQNGYKIVELDKEKTNTKYDAAIYANTKADTFVNKLEQMFDMLNQLKDDGAGYICEEAMNMLPYGRACFYIVKHIARKDSKQTKQ